MRFLTPDRVSILDDTMDNIDACNLCVYCNNNPADAFVKVGPKDGAIGNYIKIISETGKYGEISVSKLSNGMYQIANGHHRMEALRRLGYEVIKIYLTK